MGKVKKSMREAFGEALVKISEKNKKVVVLTADLEPSLKLTNFKKSFPERFFDVGISEQNMMGMAAGFALTGKIPFVTSFAIFSPGRNWEQLRNGVCYSNLNVKIIGSHAGLVTGEDGATHQALEDIAITRVIPNLIVISPADYYEVKEVIKEIVKIKSPVYVRLIRPTTEILFDEKYKFKLGKGIILEKGEDFAIISHGFLSTKLYEIKKELKKKGLNPYIIHFPTIKPLDESLLKKLNVDKIYVLEDHQKAGGLGSAISEFYSSFKPKLIKIIAVEDVFGQSGDYESLLDYYGLSVKRIVRKIVEDEK